MVHLPLCQARQAMGDGARDNDDGIAALYATLVHGAGTGEPRELARLLATIDPGLRQAPICRLADAVITRTGDPDAADIAHRAAADALAGDPPALCATLASWIGIALRRRDAASLFELRSRAEVVASTDAQTSSALVAIVDAISALATGRLAEVEQTLVAVLAGSVPSQARGVIATVRSLALQSRGLLDASVAVLDADARLLGSFDLPAELIRARAVWVGGEHARARSMVAAVYTEARTRGRTHDVAAASVTARLMARHDGDPPDAPAPQAVNPHVAALLHLDNALSLLPDRRAAATALRAHPIVRTTLPEFQMVPYILCPEWRDAYDAAQFVDGGSDVLAVARARLDGTIGQLDSWTLRNAYHPWVTIPVDEWNVTATGRTMSPAHGSTDHSAEMRTSAASPSLGGVRLQIGDIGTLAPGATGETQSSSDQPDEADAPPRAVALRVLGDVAVVVDGEVRSLRRERVRTLLVALALQRRMTRERLADLLWPDLDPSAGANNLRTTLTYARQVVPGAPLIRADGPVITLSVPVDLWDMDEAAAQARSSEEPSIGAGHWARAAELITGAFAPGVDAGRWLDAARTSVDMSSVDTLLRAGAAHLPTSPAVARRWAERALAIDPWNDRAALLAVRCWIEQGDVAAARRALSQAAELLQELGIDEIPTIEQLSAMGTGSAEPAGPLTIRSASG